MQYQQTPQGLETLYNLPTAAQPQGLALLSQQQDADALTAQDNQRQYAFDSARDPLLLTGKNLENQTLAAQLPGHVATSNMHVRTDKNQATTNDAAIQDILGKYSSADIARHTADAENIGTRLSQMGEEAFSNPIGAAARVKAELQKMNMGGMWNPDWETSHPGLLARQLGDYGADLQNTSAKLRAAQQVQEQKNQASAYAADQRVRAAEVAAAQRQATAAALMSTKEHIAKIPKGLDDYAGKMRDLARYAETPEERQKYLSEAQWAVTERANIADAAARTTTGAKADLNDVGVKTVGPNGGQAPPSGTPTPPMVGAQAANGAPITAPNAAQIQHLKDNPQLRDAFDSKFGAGAADAVLKMKQ